MVPVQGYVIVVVMFSVHPPDLGKPVGVCLCSMVQRIRGGKSPAIDTRSAQKTRDIKLPKKNCSFLGYSNTSSFTIGRSDPLKKC